MSINPSKLNSRLHLSKSYFNDVVFDVDIQEWLDIWESINVLHHINGLKGIMIISIDAENILSKSQHSITVNALGRIGMGRA